MRFDGTTEGATASRIRVGATSTWIKPNPEHDDRNLLVDGARVAAALAVDAFYRLY
jgi:hypothetical protein